MATSVVLKCCLVFLSTGGCDVPYREKRMLDGLHLGMSYSAVGTSSMFMNQQHILNKMLFKEAHMKQGYVLIC